MARPFMFGALCQRAHRLKHSLAESIFVIRVQKTAKKSSLAEKFISRVTRQPRYHYIGIARFIRGFNYIIRVLNTTLPWSEGLCRGLLLPEGKTLSAGGYSEQNINKPLGPKRNLRERFQGELVLTSSYYLFAEYKYTSFMIKLIKIYIVVSMHSCHKRIPVLMFKFFLVLNSEDQTRPFWKDRFHIHAFSFCCQTYCYYGTHSLSPSSNKSYVLWLQNTTVLVFNSRSYVSFESI